MPLTKAEADELMALAIQWAAASHSLGWNATEDKYVAEAKTNWQFSRRLAELTEKNDG